MTGFLTVTDNFSRPLKFFQVLIADTNTGTTKNIRFHWRIKEFQNWGALSRRGKILRSGVCFETPSHIPYVSVVRLENKIQIENIACWLKSKYMIVT